MKKQFRRSIAIVLAALLMFALFAGCGDSTGQKDPKNPNTSTVPPSGKPVSSNEPKYGGVMKICLVAPPASLFGHDKASKSGYMDYAVEPLGVVDNKTYEAKPFLAESFKEDPEAKTITIKLRKGIKFHDGSDLTAQVVKWNIDYLIGVGRGSQLNSPTKVECPDDYTVVVSYKTWVLGSLNALARVGIYSQKNFEDNGLDYCANHPVGTGPFVFKSYVADNKITYTRNENYWKKGLPYLDGVEVYIMTDESASLTAFVNGDIDFMKSGSQNYITQLNNYGFFNKSTPGYDDYSGFAFAPNGNVKDSPWADARVRQAVLVYGINAEEIAALTGGSTYKPYPQMSLEGSLGYNPEINDAIRYDLDKAKALLADAGYPNGFKTKMYVSAMNTHIATALQEALKRLNIEATVIEFSNTDPRRSDGVTDGIFFFNYATAWDQIPSFNRSLNKNLKTGMGRNIYYSDKFQELLEKARDAKTYDERSKYTKEMFYQFFVEDASYRNIVISNAHFFINDRIKNSQLPVNEYLAHEIWIDK